MIDTQIDIQDLIETRQASCNWAHAVVSHFDAIVSALSIGIMLAVIALYVDCRSDSAYVDGTEANGLLDAGFVIVDPDGDVCVWFAPDGSHYVESDTIDPPEDVNPVDAWLTDIDRPTSIRSCTSSF